jgi:hypothetical protein
MSHINQIDNELNLLREKLASLEEQKKNEVQKQVEKINNPLKTFEMIIDEKRKQIDRNSYSKSIPLARFYDQEKLAMMEPIYHMLKNIQERLTVLENKN